MILPILTYPDPRLRVVCTPVTNFGEPLKELAQDMLETMYQANGIGLAAPQVGITLRFLVVDCRPKKDEASQSDTEERLEVEKNIFPLFMANPKITAKYGKIMFEEGCLSVPCFYEPVERAARIKLVYQDLEGNPQELKADGLLAVVIQHEVDHINGTLFIDRIGFAQASKIKKELKNWVPKKKLKKRF